MVSLTQKSPYKKVRHYEIYNKKISQMVLQQNHLANMVRLTGLEPVRSPTRPSNVRVCLFRHNRVNVYIIHIRAAVVKPFFAFVSAGFFPCKNQGR